jgi:thioester reductase-like protein
MDFLGRIRGTNKQIRHADPEAGLHKIRAQLESFGLWDLSFAARLVPIPGDLAQPRLGLSAEAFDGLARTINVIYHNGALVHMGYAYSRLRAANVLGTQEVLRLACTHRVKPVHYVSTLSVFPLPAAGAEDTLAREAEAPGRWQGLVGGYAQSKWVAEKLVTQAGARGLPVVLYRPGRITGHSQTGAYPSADLFVSLLRELTRSGTVPDVETLQEMTPVDYVSRSIVYLSRQPASRGKYFHLINPRYVSLGQLTEVVRRRGYPLRVLPLEDWYAGLGVQNGEVSAAGLPWLLGTGGGTSVEQLRASLQPQYFDCTNTLAALAGSEICCPAADDRLLETYLDYLLRSGLLAPPPVEGPVRAKSSPSTRPGGRGHLPAEIRCPGRLFPLLSLGFGHFLLSPLGREVGWGGKKKDVDRDARTIRSFEPWAPFRSARHGVALCAARVP